MKSNVCFRIHNPPPPGLDRNNSPANASSDEGMHPPESNRHQMDKFDNQSGSLQPMMRAGYPTGNYHLLLYILIHMCIKYLL